MAAISMALNILGVLGMAHAVYSTHEHTTTTTSALHTPSPSSTAPASLPLDITIELMASLFLLSLGIVTASPQLKPIQWAQWGGKMQREGKVGEGTRTREGEEVLSEGDPYGFLGLDGGEGRRGFWDVRAKREEYAGWAKAVGR